MTIELPSMIVFCEELNWTAELFYNYEAGQWRIDFGVDDGGTVPELTRPVTDYDWIFVSQFNTPNPVLK